VKEDNMSIEKKRIDMKTAAAVLEKLNDMAEDDHRVSLGRFVTLNFEVLSRSISRSRKSIRHIYEHLKAGGLDVGTYHGFRSACYRAGLRRRPKQSVISFQESSSGVETLKEVQESQKVETAAKTREERKTEMSKHKLALPPVFLPGGVEAIIDPETGAKCFEIKSQKESE
jgi:hypothetical protein